MTDEARGVDPLLDWMPAGFVAFRDDGAVTVVNGTLLELLDRDSADVIGRHVESLLAVGSRIFYQTHVFPLLRLHGRADEIFLLLQARDGSDVGVLANGVRRERDGQWVSDLVLVPVEERRKFEDALVRARQDADGARTLAEARSREAEEATERLAEQAVELEFQREQLESMNAELVRHTQELERLRAAADAANQAKSRFLMMMSHELRTPLNAIGGYTQLLEMGVHGPATPAQLEALGRIMRSQRHLLRLVNEVLDLSRIEAGQTRYHCEGLVLRDIVESVLSMIEPQCAQRQIRLSVEVPPALVAHCDREKVQQIVLNLLSNASKFTPSGGAIRVTGSVPEADPGRVHLGVSDTGIGIAPALLDRIFDPFVQAEVNGVERVEGTGLGLAISRTLARGMGGDLRVESQERVGSTFTLALPRGGR